jgi:hypothetical protein
LGRCLNFNSYGAELETLTPKRFWARLRGELALPLRRGAWYPVKKLGPREVVLEVAGFAVVAPRAALEVESTPPRRWSVVPRPKDPARFPGVAEYAVCPACAQRAPLEERLATLRCGRCHAVFEVAWDEPHGRPPPNDAWTRT